MRRLFNFRIAIILIAAVATTLVLSHQRRMYLESFEREWQTKLIKTPVDSSFQFAKGDILARPNWQWYGSIPIPNGRKYGHVAVVIEGGTGASVEEALQNSRVIEALFFDQKTKRFLFNPDEQIRLESAWISFGKKFQGIRYRLRLPLQPKQTDAYVDFLISQINARYNIFSLKNTILNPPPSGSINLDRNSWHCGTLTWASIHTYTGYDIDGNGGILIFPSDIIASPLFDGPGQRICF